MIYNIVSKDAKKYFKDNNLTPREWINFCRKKFNLIDGDVVYYEGNQIGYIKKKEMIPKYQVGQEVWMIWSIDNFKYETKKSVIEEVYPNSFPTKQIIFTGNEPIYKLNNGPKDYYSPEWSLHSSEKEAYEYFVYDVFVSSKNCWKSELKYLEREEKLKRILDGK